MEHHSTTFSLLSVSYTHLDVYKRQVGNYVVSLLPQHVLDALNLLLPALFGALFANQIVKKPKLALVALPITGIMVLMNKLQLLSFLPGKLVTPIVMLTCVFGTMGIGLFLASKGKMD